MSIEIALAGNPNCGKTTIFNALTGSNQYVGNWPGVTVEKRCGQLNNHPDVLITDLPGIYSLSPYTMEETVARSYLVNESPDVILNILDGTNIERNLYLTTQLLELGIPMVIVINMSDIMRKRGEIIDLNSFSNYLGGCPVFEASALRDEGVRSAVYKAIELGKAEKPALPEPVHFRGLLEGALCEIYHALGDEFPRAHKRFFAVKIFERDEIISDIIDPKAYDFEKLILNTEKHFMEDAESIVTAERYSYITKITKECCKSRYDPGNSASSKIDAVLTNRYLALPIFGIIMFVIYYISISTVGAELTDILGEYVFGDGGEIFGVSFPGLPALITSLLDSVSTAKWLTSLIVDGIISGVGAVLSFVPQIMLLFIFMAFLEDCGYMSRVAFIMDGLFRRIGLSGKSFIPIIIGTGCGVPGIMASRTIESPAERRLTVITTTFIPCSAKLPMIAMFSSAFLGGAWWAAPLAYLIGACAIIVSGVMLKKTRPFMKDTSPFIMELPGYHLPRIKNVFKSMWDRTYSFIKKAGTVILLSTIVIWLLTSIGFDSGRILLVEDFSESLLSYIGRGIAWLFIPLGFGGWQAAVAAVTGLIAKENIVSTLAVLFGGGGQNILAANFTPISAFAFMVFNLLCAPCCAAMAAIAREMKSKAWTAFAIAYQTGFAYVVALCINGIGGFVAYGRLTFSTAAAVLLVIILLYMILRKPKKVK